jgi:hypothetical protein
MHRRCDFFRFWPLLALILAGAAPTVRATQVLSAHDALEYRYQAGL